MHLIESDPALSKPITDDPSAPNPGAGDWFVLIDATDVGAVPPAAMLRFGGNAALKPLMSLERRLPADVGCREERHRRLGPRPSPSAPHMLHCRIGAATLSRSHAIESWRSRKFAFVPRLEWL